MKKTRVKIALDNDLLTGYSEYVTKEAKKINTCMKQKNIIVNYYKHGYYNPFNEQRVSKKVNDIMDPAINNYIIIRQKDFSHDAFVIETELNDTKDLLFIKIFKLNMSCITTIDAKFKLWSIFVIDRNKKMFKNYYVYSKSSTLEFDTHFFNTRCNWKENTSIINSLHRDYNKYPIVYFDTHVLQLKTALKYSAYGEENFKQIASEISELTGGNVKTISANKIVNIKDSIDNLCKYLSYKEPSSKTSKVVQDLLNYKLSEVDYNKYQDPTFGYADRLDDKTCVLRILTHNESTCKNEDIAKIFIQKNKITAIKKTNSGQWIKTQPGKLSNWDFAVYNADSELLKNTIFDYTKQMIEEVDEIPYAQLLQMMIIDPTIEQLYKSELKNVLIQSLKYSHDSINIEDYVVQIFCGINTKQKSLNKKLGLNTHQIKKISKRYDEIGLETYYHPTIYRFLIMSLRNVFCNPLNANSKDFVDLSFIDDDTFDEFLDIINIMAEKNFMYSGCTAKFIYHTIQKCGAKTAMKYLKDNIESIERAFCDDFRVRRKFIDYCSMFVELKEMNPELVKNYPLHFTMKDGKLDSLTSAHDIITEIYNIQKNALYDEKFKVQIKKIKKYEFNADGFLSVVPTKANDLAVEGMTLHHCVKSYIGRVANGSTNIMFIRKKDEPEKPFFTVEISNNGVIEQIHGMNNCNVESNSELSKYIKEWIKTVKLKPGNFNRVR